MREGVWQKKWVRVGAIIAILLVSLFAGLMWLGLHMDEVLAWKAERDARAYEAVLEAEEAELIAMEKADTYGATTPEGTVALIIAALEVGDITLASKYYYVLDQDKAMASFQKQLAENGNLDIAIAFFKDISRGTKKCNEQTSVCVLRNEYLRNEDESIQFPGASEPTILKKGSIGHESLSFQVNTYTGFWKAIEI